MTGGHRSDDGRIRGRRGVELRKRRLAAEPLCRHCKQKGVIRRSVTPDHIVPLALGGTETDDNIQCLCEPCHSYKTALEAASHHAASNHPDWLKPSAIPLTILSGPPCSGKTTYIQEQASPDDIVIDLDSIMNRINPRYVHWQGGLDKALFNKAIRVRNALLGSLHRMKHGRAWFIVSAPTHAERSWWLSKLGGTIVLLDPGLDECKRRAIYRGTPRAIDGIDQWHKASKLHWEAARPRAAKTITGADGWPTE